MPEPVLPENPQPGDSGAMVAFDALNAFHNDWTYPDGSRQFQPADLLAGVTPWIVIADAGATYTFVGDAAAGAWTDLGDIGDSVTVNG